MAIACRGCGRQYDVSLFEYGRTIRCTCGSVVGLEHRVEIDTSPGPPAFFADAMLERLARWLRILGFDCALERGIPDADLVRRASAERRVILTRDRDIRSEWRVLNVFDVPQGSTSEQLAAVVARFDLARHARPFTRCSRCNELLAEADPAAVAGLVPESVAREQRQFLRCHACGRVYWAGSHASRMRAVIESLMARS
jgi:uncharacterized protein